MQNYLPYYFIDYLDFLIANSSYSPSRKNPFSFFNFRSTQSPKTPHYRSSEHTSNSRGSEHTSNSQFLGKKFWFRFSKPKGTYNFLLRNYWNYMLFSFSRYLIFCLDFLSCRKKGLIRNISWILKFMTSQPGSKTITAHILPNISRFKGNPTVKFG